MEADMTEQELQDLQKMVETAVEALDDIKADNISVLETQDKTSLFSRMIIASGDSSRQVKALANNVAVSLKEAGFEILSTEGQRRMGAGGRGRFGGARHAARRTRLLRHRHPLGRRKTEFLRRRAKTLACGRQLNRPQPAARPSKHVI